MPRGNGTGPAGLGPMTGRAAGYCAGYPVPGYMNPYGGRVAAGVPYAYPPSWNYGAYPASPYGLGAYPAYGPYWPRGRPFGLGFGRGRGWWRGRGRW